MNEAYTERLLDAVQVDIFLVGYSVTPHTLALLAEYMRKDSGVQLLEERIRQLLPRRSSA